MEEIKEKTPKVKDTWEYKDRHYYLASNKEPLTYTIPSKHTQKISFNLV
jgi:hypothetical protein